jgi:hypothetical protein
MMAALTLRAQVTRPTPSDTVKTESFRIAHIAVFVTVETN